MKAFDSDPEPANCERFQSIYPRNRWFRSDRGYVLARFAAFYVREGFALGIVIGIALAVFMPYELPFKVVGFIFAVVVSFAACAVQFRRARKRGSSAD